MKFFEDSIATYQEVGHQGFYVVDGKKYQYRYNAYVEATKTGKNIEWNFNDEVYRTTNWFKPLNRTLADLYRERAQQLRDKYDYLILSYSGGSDSDNMLQAFINNGIPVDEVWVDWPLHMMEKTNWKTSTSVDHANLASEWHLNLEPRLRELRLAHPEIKIHVSDCTSQGRLEDAEDTSSLVNFRGSYFYLARRRYIQEYQRDLSDRGVNSAVVIGLDKPNLLFRDNNICALFWDEGTIFKTNVTADNKSVVEFFYWTPDSPYMIVNQAHEIIKFLQRNPAEFKRVESHLKDNSKPIQRSENLDYSVNAACYPTWRPGFQTNKTKYVFEDQQFHSLLVPFIRTEKFAQVYYHRYHADASLIREDLVFLNEAKTRGRPMTKYYPVMSLQRFYQGLQQTI